MKTPIRDLWQRYRDATTRVSDLTRQLGFAGIALIWVLRPISSTPGLGLPPELVRPATLIVCALFLDFMQYVFASVVWRISASRAEKTHENLEQGVESPPWCVWPLELLFVLKVIALLVAYVLLFCFLYPALTPQRAIPGP